MDYFAGCTLRPLARLSAPALSAHRERISENEAWRSFDGATAARLGALGFFHARDLAWLEGGEVSARAHWPALGSLFRFAGRECADLAFLASLAEQIAALDLWRRLDGEGVSFCEEGQLFACALGSGPAGVGSLSEGYFLGFAPEVVNAPRATHFLARGVCEGESVLVAFARDEAVITADLAAVGAGFWTGCFGEAAFHGAEVLPGDVKLRGAAVAGVAEEFFSLREWLLANAALGVLEITGSGRALGACLHLEGILLLQAEACGRDDPTRAANLARAATAALGSLPEVLAADSENFLTRKLGRDLARAESFSSRAPIAAATSRPANQAG